MYSITIIRIDRCYDYKINLKIHKNDGLLHAIMHTTVSSIFKYNSMNEQLCIMRRDQLLTFLSC